MFDLTLTKELAELMGKSFKFREIETIGKYLFKNYSTHKLEDIPESITISPLNAAKRLVNECEYNNKFKDLLSFIIELDGTLLNGKKINIIGLENLLYKLANTGIYFDFNKRKLKSYNQETQLLKNWGALKEGREYPITIASLDICDNSNLYKKYKQSIMEEVYFHLWEYIRKKLEIYDGRIWSWAGDGTILAFKNDKDRSAGVSCCLEIIFSLPVFNSSSLKRINDDISIRIGMDSGLIKFINDTGRIISAVINYASHLQKNATCPNGLSISDNIYKGLSPSMREMFTNNTIFEDKLAYSLSFDYSKALC